MSTSTKSFTIKINKRAILTKKLAQIYYDNDNTFSYEWRLETLNNTYNTPHPITGEYFWTIKMLREQIQGVENYYNKKQ